jgi:hypothetical protein
MTWEERARLMREAGVVDPEAASDWDATREGALAGCLVTKSFCENRLTQSTGVGKVNQVARVAQCPCQAAYIHEYDNTT